MILDWGPEYDGNDHLMALYFKANGKTNGSLYILFSSTGHAMNGWTKRTASKEFLRLVPL